MQTHFTPPTSAASVASQGCPPDTGTKTFIATDLPPGYIERFYSPKRRHSKLGYHRPIAFEDRAMQT
ncbi:hypothetical protein [Citreimonas salinaria]|uniref:Uncharacterized protein n=1 Tax=Citreimonas salinaria TaxID=321339 RepID=A0A1H3P216_9RHOB|nr:hypothetical protein [Citreimonas salinaria]SDY95080.1 hypothetical protein SAMN05444340_1434 [Citreimonas salinaria]